MGKNYNNAYIILGVLFCFFFGGVFGIVAHHSNYSVEECEFEKKQQIYTYECEEMLSDSDKHKLIKVFSGFLLGYLLGLLIFMVFVPSKKYLNKINKR